MLNQLKHIGLSENEAKVYLAMLELGPAPVLEIAVKADINRPTAYVQVDSLKKKGLVSMQTKGKKQLYIAEDPDQFEFLIEREKKGLEQKQAELKEVLPELKELFNTMEDRPHVRFFEGKEGLERMQNDLLRSGAKETRGISSANDIYRIFPQHKTSYVSDRVKRGIRSRLIYTASGGPIYKEKDTEMLREALFVPQEKLNFHADLDIYGDFISISALTGKLSGIIIHHKNLADSFRTLFDFLWNTYKQKNRGPASYAKPSNKKENN